MTLEIQFLFKILSNKNLLTIEKKKSFKKKKKD